MNPLFISEQEFLQLAQEIYAYWEKCGYFARAKQVYDMQHLPPAEEYLEFCVKTRRFTDALSTYSSYIGVKSREPWAAIFSEICLEQLLHFSIVWDKWEKNHSPTFPSALTMAMCYDDQSPLQDTALQLGLIEQEGHSLRLAQDTVWPLYGNLYHSREKAEERAKRNRGSIPLFNYTIGYYWVGHTWIESIHFPFLIVENGQIEQYHPTELLKTLERISAMKEAEEAENND